MSDQTIQQISSWRERIRKPSRGPILFALGMAAALAAMWIYGLLTPKPHPVTLDEINEAVAQALASATSPPPFSAYVYRTILPSLVYIQTEIPDGDGNITNGIGSGVIIDNRGDILTSLHVVANASDIMLTFVDGTQSEAQVVIRQIENDIAVLAARDLPESITPAVLGNPAAMRVGDEAFVVGHPLGLFDSMSAGVISGFDRSFESVDGRQKLEGLIQVDAAVNPGNSGGPLLNREGHVVGIVAALANPTDQDVFIGIGFAVPINVAVSAVGSPPY